MPTNDFLKIAEEEKRDYKFNRWYNQSLVTADKVNIDNTPSEVKYDDIPIKKYTLSLPITDQQFADFFNVGERVLSKKFNFVEKDIMAKMFAKKPMGFQREDGRKTGYNTDLFIPEFLPSPPNKGKKYEFADSPNHANAIGSAQNLFTQCTLEQFVRIHETGTKGNFTEKMLRKPMRTFFSEYMSSIFDFIHEEDKEESE